MFKSFIKSIFPQKSSLSKEAFDAYFNRLPDSIQVDWFRDGNFIIGNISDGSNKFMIQGKNPDDFIDMVNDAVIAMNNIPSSYVDVIKKSKTYVPNSEERKSLGDVAVMSATMGIIKDNQIKQLALV
jgi:hypothetical protein